jgi:hypothetical protein
LAAHLDLNEGDGTFEAIRRKTAQGLYEALNYHRFADDIVITVSGHSPKRGWAKRAWPRLEEPLAPLGVEGNREKTKRVDTLKGEALGCLGLDLRRGRKRQGEGYYLRLTPKKKARKALKVKIRDIVRSGGAAPAKTMVSRMKAALAGGVNYCRVGTCSCAFSEVRDYTEMKVRPRLTRGKRRRKRSIGGRRGSNEHLYEGLGLDWDGKLHPLPSAEQFL